MPLLLLLLLLIGGPLLEISVLIEVGERIGTLPAIGLTVLTAAVGLAIARMQGVVILGRMQQSLGRGEPPVAELVHGFFLFIAGVCLFIPGFISDGFGVLLLFPFIRTALGRAGIQRMFVSRKPTEARRDASGKLIIEGEYWESEKDGHPDQDEKPGQG